MTNVNARPQECPIPQPEYGVAMQPTFIQVGMQTGNGLTEVRINSISHYLTAKELRYLADMANLTADQLDPKG
jgi:hypothetical protein